MSLIDDALAGYIQIETAKANNPRAVQTAEQNQTARRTSIDAATAEAAGRVNPPATIPGFAGFNKPLLYAGLGLLGLVLVVKVLK